MDEMNGDFHESATEGYQAKSHPSSDPIRSLAKRQWEGTPMTEIGRYISGGWICPDGKRPDASRPPVGRTRGGESYPRPL
ncbi:MAG: hypothetical protein ACQESR_01250 [Planctomycetota bacterium]